MTQDEPPRPLFEGQGRKRFAGSRVYQLFLMIISSICSCLFLFILVGCASIEYAYKSWIKHEHRYVESPNPAYPYNDMAIVDDLSYYVELIGLRLYRYRLTTEDGFIIEMSRVVDPTRSEGSKKPILLIHGLMQSSASFIMSGYKSLAYQLCKNGYDVFLGTNRCGFEPQHLEYDSWQPQMWDWDLKEMTKYDLTCMIDQVKSISGYEGKIALAGHSQGTVEIIMMIANQYEVDYNDKVDKCILFAPAAYGGPLLDTKLFIRFMRMLPDSIYDIFFGSTAFIPIMNTLRDYTLHLPTFGFTSYAMFSTLFNSNDYLWDHSIRDYLFIFSPIYTSSRLMKWWLKGRGFRKGKPVLDTSGPWFNETTPSILLVVGGQDSTVDGFKFIDHIKNSEPDLRDRLQHIIVDKYGHLDVLWADDVQELVGEPILEYLSN